MIIEDFSRYRREFQRHMGTAVLIPLFSQFHVHVNLLVLLHPKLLHPPLLNLILLFHSNTFQDKLYSQLLCGYYQPSEIDDKMLE